MAVFNLNDDITLAYLLKKVKTDVLSALNAAVEKINISLDGKVPVTRKVNDHALSADVTVTKGDLGLGNVENKSSATIRGELTGANVTNALGYEPVDKAGDTMTGGLVVENFVAVKRGSGNGVVIDDQSMDSTTNPSSAKNGITLAFRDKNGVAYAVIRARHTAGGYKGLYVYGNNSSAPSGKQTNALLLMVDNDGHYLVSVTDEAAWRAALGLGSSSGELPITIGQGGTGQTSVFSTSDKASIATAGTNITISSADYAQWGKVAQLRIVFSRSAAVASGNTTIATLVSGKRPVFNALATAHTNHDLVAYVNASGNVVVNGAITAGTSYTVYATYLLP